MFLLIAKYKKGINVHVCTEAWKLDAVDLKRPCHAKEASAVVFPALFAVHIRYNNMYLGF
jgi:hypothetical protein